MIDLNKCANYEIAKQCFSEDLAFRIRSRRNRLLGFWAAAEIGLSGERAYAYARSIVALGIEYPVDHDLVRHLVQDLCASSARYNESVVLSEMDRLSEIATLEYAVNEPHLRSRAA